MSVRLPRALITRDATDCGNVFSELRRTVTEVIQIALSRRPDHPTVAADVAAVARDAVGAQLEDVLELQELGIELAH
jgi:hypothetical protein